MRQRFKVTGMSCAACSAGVERAVGRLKGVNSVEVSLVAKSMVCDFDENIISEKEIANAVKKAGFKAYPEKSADSSQGADRNAGANPIAETDGFTPMKTRLIVSLIFLVLLMYVSMGHMIGLPVPAFMHGIPPAVCRRSSHCRHDWKCFFNSGAGVRISVPAVLVYQADRIPFQKGCVIGTGNGTVHYYNGIPAK